MSRAQSLIKKLNEFGGVKSFERMAYARGTFGAVGFVIRASYYPDKRMLEVSFSPEGTAQSVHYDDILRNRMSMGRVLLELGKHTVDTAKRVGLDDIDDIVIKDENSAHSERKQLMSMVVARIARAVYTHPGQSRPTGMGMEYRISIL